MDLIKKGVVVLLIIILFSIFYFLFVVKDCNDNEECFNECLKKCESAKLLISKSNNIYSYYIKRSWFSNECKLTIKVEQMAVGTDLQVKKALEGKSMECIIPKDKTSEFKVGEMKNLLDYCSGSLKEGMYGLIIERMYGLIIKQMGGIMEGIEKEMEGL